MSFVASIPAPAAPSPGRSAWRLMVLFLGVSLSTVLVLVLAEAAGHAWQEHRRQPSLAELWQDGVLRARLLPARLGGFDHAPYPTFETRSPGGWKALRQRVSRGVETGEGGVAQLLSEAWLGMAEKSDLSALHAALLRLEAATADPAAPAEVWSDLAAVRYSLALDQGEPYLYLGALDAARQALELDPGNLAALFNRALCLEALGIWREAKATWERYLDLDRTSGWAGEAEGHLLNLLLPDPENWPTVELKAAARAGDFSMVREIVRDFRTPSRRLLEEEILRDWGTARLAAAAAAPEQRTVQEAEAAALLEEARAIAQVYGELAEDSLYVGAVMALEGAAGGGLLELAAAHRDFGRAVRAIDVDEDIDLAGSLLAPALRAFADHSSPFALRAELKLAIVEQRNGRHEAVLAHLLHLRQGMGATHSANLLGESYWVEGHSYARTRRLADAEIAYRQAEPWLEAAGELDTLAGLRSMQAEGLDLTGQTSEAWKTLTPVLGRSGWICLPRRLYQIYSNAALSATRIGYPEIGLLYMDEAAPWTAGAVQNRVEAPLWRADFLRRLGRTDAARQELQRFQEQLPALEGVSRRRLEARARAIEGELLLEEDPAAAEAFLEKSLALDLELSDHVWENHILQLLGRARRRQGGGQKAAEPLERSLTLREDQRRGLDEEDRVAWQEIAEGAFEELIGLEIEAGSPERALTWQERRRARTLLDRFTEPAGHPAGPLEAEELRRQWPADLALVEYAFVGEPRRLYAWVLSEGRLEGFDLEIEEADLAPRIRRWLGDLDRGLPLSRIRIGGFELYDSLIRPLSRRLPPGVDWVVVPDGILRDLPFAALHDGRQFVVEGRALALAPSASFYLAALRRNRALMEPGPRRPLILGNPSFDRRRFPALDLLPAAELEATRLAKMYGVPAFLGPRASRPRFVEEAAHHDLLQISSHAWLHPLSPQSSSLLLAEGELTVREIGGMRLEKTRLAVLSACRTAGGTPRNGEAVESLANAFLATGVPGVVATLWDVEDAPTAELMKEFHHQLRLSGHVRKALQATQIQFLHRDDPGLNRPAVWAAFHLVGEAAWPSPGGALQP